MPTHSLRHHRLGAAAALGIAAVVGGVGAGAATAVSYDDESIQQYQIDATLEGDTLSVTETIDYDFAINSRRGIIRELDLGIVDQAGTVGLANTRAATNTANDDLQVTEDSRSATLRVGDPDETFRGQHRYQLGYDLVGVPDPEETGRFVFVAVGDRWDVPIEEVTMRVATDFEPGDLSCSIGGRNSFEPCEVSAQDGVVTASVDKLSTGEGVVLEIGTGAPRSPANLDAPSLAMDDSGDSPFGTAVIIGVLAALGGIVGSLLAGRWVRRAGSDRTGSVANPSEAAFTRVGATTGSADSEPAEEGSPISDTEAAEQVTVQFAPPEGLTPPEGAVLVREGVDNDAKTAWLAQAVIDGWMELDGDEGSPVITHTERADRDPSHMPAPLAAIFNGRREVVLGSYDEDFAAGWDAIGTKLTVWKSSSGLWDEERGQRNSRAALGVLFAALAAVVIVGIALLAGLARVPLLAVPAVVVTGLLFGAGVRAALGGPTLAVRNPAGYGLWLRTEGFRRFLAESEGEHARRAADQGMLLEYSAWAVALGELDHWNRAAAAAGISPTDPGLATTASFVGLHHVAHTTTVPPSSSGGGGFGGGGFSGGGFSGGVGGGGGGSW